MTSPLAEAKARATAFERELRTGRAQLADAQRTLQGRAASVEAATRSAADAAARVAAAYEHVTAAHLTAMQVTLTASTAISRSEATCARQMLMSWQRLWQSPDTQ